MAEQATEKHTPTTAEERTQRRVFWATVPIHDPPLLAGFERRLLHDYDALRQQNERLLGALRWTHDRVHLPYDDGRPSCALTCPARAAIQEAEGS